MCKGSFRSIIQVDASRTQSLQQRGSCHTLSFKETLMGLDQVAEERSVEKFKLIVQKCRKKKDLAHAKHLHASICNHGLESHRAIENHIVPMFVECGSLSDAQQVFNTLVHPNEHSWTSLILGYALSGESRLALKLYKEMQEEHVHPTSFTLVPLLKACATLKDVKRGQEIHSDIAHMGFTRDLLIGNTLISMYAKCDSLSEAQDVLDKLPVQDVVSWNALIAGFAEHGSGHDTLKCFEQMKLDGVSPDAVTFVCVLKACGIEGTVNKGREVYMEIAQREFEIYPLVGNTLVYMFAKCGSISEAREVFDKLPIQDVVSWNCLVAGYAELGSGHEALKCFEQMQLDGVFLDAVTLVCLLKACCSVKAIDKGREIHMEIKQKGLERDLFVGSALIGMYAKCGLLPEAREVFDMLPVRKKVSWTALIAGYVEVGFGHEALTCFEDMQLEGVPPDAVTCVSVLKACGSIGSLETGRKFHAEITQKGFERDNFVGNTLVDVYFKCGLLSEAIEVFDNLLFQSVVSWNALIAGYMEHGPCLETLQCFEQMQMEGIIPDVVTFISILRACGSIGAIDKGHEIYMEITKQGFERDTLVGNTLVDMYARCGLLLEAGEIFNKLPTRDVVSWNALILGFGVNRKENLALQCLQDMKEQGVKPNAITFTCLFTACSQASLASDGREYFSVMTEEYGIAPTTTHFACMIDLLARSGHLHEAEKFLETMPCCVSDGTWRALLGGCQIYGEVKLGLRCFQQLFQMIPEDASSYVLMADIFASAGRWGDVSRIEQLRKQAGAKKMPASALIEVNKKVHEFVLGNKPSKEMLVRLEILSSRMKEKGYVPNLDQVLKSISDKNSGASCDHVEKLTVSFGPPGIPGGNTKFELIQEDVQ